jgi:hypothetical protein
MQNVNLIGVKPRDCDEAMTGALALVLPRHDRRHSGARP